MPDFVIEFPLKTEPYQKDILDKRLEIARMVQNSLINVVLKRYKEMIKTKRYRELKAQLGSDKKKNEPIYQLLNGLYKEYGLYEYALDFDVKKMQDKFKENIDSMTAQKISKRVWTAFRKLLYSDGKEVHFKKYGSVNSFEGKSNLSGIRFKDDCIFWNGLKMPVAIDYDNLYENEAMKNKVKYCRIIRRFVKNKYKYYVQFIMGGIPPTKYDKETGEVKHPVGEGDVGLDIGTSTLAFASKTQVGIVELADKAQGLEAERKRLQRKLDRSRRATNPDNYDKNGTVKKLEDKKLEWVRSNHYKKNLYALKEIYRKQAAIRRYQHFLLANYIVSLGDKIYVEDMDFKALQKRAKTKTDENGKPIVEKQENLSTVVDKKGNEKQIHKCKRKKRFGKSIANRAPAMLLAIIDNKLKANGLSLIKINTWEAKASQYDHVNKTYKKKALLKRWNDDIDGNKLQRDMYSAFLIMNINEDLKSFNEAKCNNRFPSFLEKHDAEVERLKGQKNLSSIGI